MLYLNEKNLKEVGVDWQQLVDVIENAVRCLAQDDFAQPIKPYLRYRDLTNRIIAMPAFIGGEFDTAGIKWIASFPGNIHRGIPRAHSVVILNQADTGQPMAIINTALLSILRTASVSGLMLRYFNRVRSIDGVNLGIVGFGPIGQYQLRMCTQLLGDRLSKVTLYDLRPVDKTAIDFLPQEKIVVADNWQDAYEDADVFITATVSKAPYIDLPPKKGSLQLNVSLRDFKTSIYDYVKNAIIVDNWEEICRQNTDIENMHKEKGLLKEHTKSIIDMVTTDCMKDYPADSPIMFNPMGMAVFDMALGAYFVKEARKKNIGQELE